MENKEKNTSELLQLIVVQNTNAVISVDEIKTHCTSVALPCCSPLLLYRSVCLFPHHLGTLLFCHSAVYFLDPNDMWHESAVDSRMVDKTIKGEHWTN